MRRFHQLTYRAREWGRSRKLVARVEATSIGTDVRFIVTSLEGRGKTLYEKVFCARSNAENLIKDMKRFTRSDKTACLRWQANQFRLFLHVGAYWLLHSLRQAAPKRSRWRGATFETIRRAFCEDRRARRGVEGPHQARFSSELPAGRDARRDSRLDHEGRPVTGAACAAGALHANPEVCPRTSRFKPANSYIAAHGAPTSRIEGARRAIAAARSLRLSRLRT